MYTKMLSPKQLLSNVFTYSVFEHPGLCPPLQWKMSPFLRWVQLKVPGTVQYKLVEGTYRYIKLAVRTYVGRQRT
jgi:hypothetical protein